MFLDLPYLISYWLVGIFGEMPPWLLTEQDGIVSSLSANEHRPAAVCLSGSIPLRLMAPQGRIGQASAKIPGSARYEPDKKRESEGGNPPSGRENPELPSLVLVTPRNNSFEKIRREKIRLRRVGHGSARAIENLRGVRLSLVPPPELWKCLLPGL
jgi:hypothetical protein